MRVVSNTSLLSNLAVIERLDLVKDQFATVAVPEAVWDELGRLKNARAKNAIHTAKREGWLSVEIARDQRLVSSLLRRIDRGEAEAISLAASTSADLLIIDERDGRKAAAVFDLPVIGTHGIIIRARSSGQVESVQSEMRRLRQEARFFIAADLEREVLELAGE